MQSKVLNAPFFYLALKECCGKDIERGALQKGRKCKAREDMEKIDRLYRALAGSFH